MNAKKSQVFPMTEQFSDTEGTKQPSHAAWLRKIAKALQDIRYGSLEIVIHEGRIVQIERKEKIRLDPSSHKND